MIPTTTNEILTKEELLLNDQNKKNLFDLISSGDAILMVGAGSSANLYPPWKELIENLYQEAFEHNDQFSPWQESEDFLEFAERAKACIGPEKYYHLIYRLYKPIPPLTKNIMKLYVLFPLKQ